MKLSFTFKVEPMAIQSARFAKIGEHMRSYQPKRNKDYKNWIRIQAMQQLPDDWSVVEGPISVDRMSMVFAPLKSLRAPQKRHISDGGYVIKMTKPDLMDNLAKGLMDSLEGLVYKNDSQIWSSCKAMKVYGENPRIELDLTIGVESDLLHSWQVVKEEW